MCMCLRTADLYLTNSYSALLGVNIYNICMLKKLGIALGVEQNTIIKLFPWRVYFWSTSVLKNSNIENALQLTKLWLKLKLADTL